MSAIDDEVGARAFEDVTTADEAVQARQRDFKDDHIVFSLLGTSYAVAIGQVTDLEKLPALTAVPHVPDFVLGVANLRGDIISVLDLRTFLGFEQSERLDKGRVLIVKVGEDQTTSGLMVDEVQGIRSIPGEDIGAPAAPLEDKVSGLLRGVEAVSPELLEAFRTESDEHLQSIGGALRELEKKPADQELLQQIRRSVHTLKGAAGMVGLRQTSSLAHRMEDLLDELHGGGIHYSKDIQELLFSTADCLEDLSAAEADERPVTTQTGDLYSAYTALLGEQQTAPSVQPSTPSPGSLPSLGEEKIIDLAAMGSESPGEKAAVEAGGAAAPAAARQSGQHVRVPLERLDELVRLVSELIVNRSTFEQHFGRYTHEVDELALSTDRLKRISTKLETDYAVEALVQQESAAYTGVREPSLPRTPASNGGGGHGEFDTLEFDRYGEFHLMSRDLSETASDINSVENQLGALSGDFDSYLNRLGRLTSEVQDRLMRLRMVPLATIATRLHRTVRVTASKKRKTGRADPRRRAGRIRQNSDRGDHRAAGAPAAELSGSWYRAGRASSGHRQAAPWPDSSQGLLRRN